MITIFTPTYNRAYMISNLYESLKNQTSFDFEWLIVDDGSIDDTEKLCKEFISEANFTIRYYKQENGGKHRAINRGISKAVGDLFFIVDSDDYLAETTVAFLNEEWCKIKDLYDYVGISGTRVNPSWEKIGDILPFDQIDCSVIDFRFKYGYKGDMAEAWKTEILRENLFPEIQGENFITEALIWNRISKNKKVRYFNRPIYVCKYLEDGLTSSMTKLRIKNPRGCQLYYSEEAKLNTNLKQILKSYINYWRFSFGSNIKFKESISKIGYISLIGYLPAFLIHLLDIKKKD